MKIIFVSIIGNARDCVYLFYDTDKQIFIKASYNFKLYIVMYYICALNIYSLSAIEYFDLQFDLMYRIIMALFFLVLGLICGKFHDLYKLTYNLKNEYMVTKDELDMYLSNKFNNFLSGYVSIFIAVILIVLVVYLLIYDSRQSFLPIYLTILWLCGYVSSSYIFSNISFRDRKKFIQKYNYGEIKINENK